MNSERKSSFAGQDIRVTVKSSHGRSLDLFRQKSTACPNCTFAALCKIVSKQIAVLSTAICRFEFFNDFKKSSACPKILSKTHVRGEGNFTVG